MRGKDDVWITGVGTINPLGDSYEKTAKNLLAGKSGIRQINEFPIADHLPQFGGVLESIPAPPSWDQEEFARLGRLEQINLYCSAQALQSAGLWDSRTKVRIGMVMGLGGEWMQVWEEDQHRGGNRIYDPQTIHDSLLVSIQRQLGLSGPAVNVGAACAGGNYALAVARCWLTLGWIDVCLAGGGDQSITPMSVACFGNLRVLSRRNHDPQAASRPFDRGRDGLVLGEGGAMFVLESAARARRRGARAYAEIAGFGASSDAFHMVIPNSNPEPVVSAMRAGLAEAAIAPEEIGYLNAHATSTPQGDSSESRALREVLGEAVDKVPVSSTKSMTGHLLSGAAAMNALAGLVALDYQAIPPTINLENPDPECALWHVPGQALSQPVNLVVSNSFGFGGCNTSLVLRKVA